MKQYKICSCGQKCSILINGLCPKCHRLKNKAEIKQIKSINYPMDNIIKEAFGESNVQAIHKERSQKTMEWRKNSSIKQKEHTRINKLMSERRRKFNMNAQERAEYHLKGRERQRNSTDWDSRRVRNRASYGRRKAMSEFATFWNSF